MLPEIPTQEDDRDHTDADPERIDGDIHVGTHLLDGRTDHAPHQADEVPDLLPETIPEGLEAAEVGLDERHGNRNHQDDEGGKSRKLTHVCPLSKDLYPLKPFGERNRMSYLSEKEQILLTTAS